MPTIEEYRDLHTTHLSKKRAEFSGWLMSNAKWRKLFTWLTERNNKISSYKIKLLLAEANVLWETRVLRVSDLEETHLADKDLYPIGYDEIEWVDVVTPHSDQLLT